MRTVPPDWYPDPENEGFLRYWNGRSWTPDRRVGPVSADRPGEASKVPLFGARGYAERQTEELAAALAENRRLRAQVEQFGGGGIDDLQQLRARLEAEVAEQQAVRDELLAQVVDLREEHILQEIGIYEFRHPLSDSVAYRDALKRLQGEIKAQARRDAGAIEALKAWVVEGSVADGRKMVREYSKLMLRAYNAETENIVRGLKPYKLPKELDRLDRLAETLNRFGATMQLRVSPEYHALRRRELELTADHLEMLARQKDYERDERERRREAERARQEYAREQARLERQQEKEHATLTGLEADGKGDTESADQLRASLAEREQALSIIRNRANDTRGGYLYVLSNVGAFGDGVVQIGVTRRFDPESRIQDLSNSSVPFRYDRHVMFFDPDAAGIEAELHRRFEHRRVNKVNRRREFFRATAAEVNEQLRELTDTYYEFTEHPEAVQYHQSRNTDSAAEPRTTA
ncbi:DUF4041 domain-containing protein [Nocardia sp. NPDC001965]